MRVNVYSQELTDEVLEITKESNTGIVYHAAQLVLLSSFALHHPPEDDDRSAVTFWLPTSPERREAMAIAFEKIAAIFRGSSSSLATIDPYDDISEADIPAVFGGLRQSAELSELPPHKHDEDADAFLVMYATAAMTHKLRISRDRGRGGWWCSKSCSIDLLRHLLSEHIQKGDMRDVMNLAAMIYVREIADSPIRGSAAVDGDRFAGLHRAVENDPEAA